MHACTLLRRHASPACAGGVLLSLRLTPACCCPYQLTPACCVSMHAIHACRYDIGIAGGVTTYPDLQRRFFPSVLEPHGADSAFCKYNDPLLTFFVSVLFLTGIVGAIIGSYASNHYGRRITMMLGGAGFLAGAALMAPAVHISMLILGRAVMGLGKPACARAALWCLPACLYNACSRTWPNAAAAAVSRMRVCRRRHLRAGRPVVFVRACTGSPARCVWCRISLQSCCFDEPTAACVRCTAGAFNTQFQLFVTVGILLAQLVR